MNEQKTQINLKVSTDFFKLLKTFAASEGLKMTEVIVTSVNRYMEFVRGEKK